ncbi:HTH-type transcriptional regulator BetI [compost metagenome]|jgi:AcrR family transcriptional regulator|uniref:TetR/AcrR family transcriptional regulator n=1 Tax=Sphingobacterium TaxID=28453 RepID=UPI000FAB11D5|nr:TetR/AcrR family transcriptional regulator [Sphingobacterium sp. GVS05A]MDF2478821.1 TetR family transcriptional regulator [Sphingobacterium sp.]
MRKTYKGEKNDKERTMNKLILSVGQVLRDKGYTGLTIANISKIAGVDRKLISLYFGSVDNLVETYIRSKDYWVAATLGAVEYFGTAPTEGSKGFLESLLINQMDSFLENTEMQKAVLWQISEKSEIMSQITREREKMSALFFAFADKEMEGKNVDLRAISSILTAGIYYLVLHSINTESTFCEIELNADGLDRIRNAVKTILSWAYGENEKNPTEA